MNYCYISFEDRKNLEQMYLDGLSLQEIAKKLGVHLATIYRELRRGSTGMIDQNGRSEYKAAVAQRTLIESFKRRGRKHFALVGSEHKEANE